MKRKSMPHSSPSPNRERLGRELRTGKRKGPLFVFFVVALLLCGVAFCFAGQVPEYSYGNLPSQTLSTYLPSDGLKARPGALLIHGGGWTGGDKAPAQYLCQLLARNGIVAVATNYRLANSADLSTRWPAQLEDAEAAFQWMIAHSGEMDLDPGRISVFGLSAGGHIAVWLGIKDKRVASVIDAFGPVDLTKVETDRRYVPSLTALIGNPNDNAAVRAASPVYHIRPDVPPTLIIQGENDDLVAPDQSKALYDVMKSAGAQVEIIMYPGGHSWQGLSPASKSAIDMQVISFIKKARTQ